MVGGVAEVVDVGGGGEAANALGVVPGAPVPVSLQDGSP
jgi:hypothetical protein